MQLHLDRSVSHSPADFTSTPGLLRFLRWLFFHPSAWHNYIALIDPTLSPLFCLPELTREHWRNPLLRRLLWMGCLVWPLLLCLAFALWMGGTGQLLPLAFVGVGFGLVMGFVLSMAVGLALGIAVGVGSGITFGIAWAYPDILLIDMMFSTRFAWIFGVTSAISLHIAQNLAQISTESTTHQAGKQTRGFTVGALIGTIVFGLVVGGIILLIQARQANLLADAGPGLIFSSVPSLLLGSAIGWRLRSWMRGLVSGGIFFFLLLSLLWNAGSEFGRDPNRVVLLVSFTITIVFVYLVLFIMPFVVVDRIIGARTGTIAGALAGLGTHFATEFVIDFYALWPNLYWGLGLVGLGLTMRWWRPVLFYPFEVLWSLLLLRLAVQGSTHDLLQRHAAFWDELQYLPLVGLDNHLVFVAEQNAVQGQVVIDYLSTSRQRWAAQAAQIELDARRLARCTAIEAIAAAHESLAAGLLTGPASALLRTFSKLSEDAAAGLTQRSRFNQRLVLTGLENDLNGLLRELTRSSERYAARFRPIATSWRNIVAVAVAELDMAMTELREIPNPYVVGVPLSRRQEIFVGRTDISRRIEGLLRDQDHPPILLYGQRRMGKTSLLYQLRWMLPRRTLSLVVDLQGPVALANSHAAFLYNLAKGMQTSAAQQEVIVERLTHAALDSDPFTVFDDWLDALEETVVAQNRNTILLALDEFEALDIAIEKERLDEDAVLGTLRHIIQHRPHFKLLLAGSHTLNEFRRWSSYLINAQVVHLTYLHADEALRLVEQPIQDFALSYTPEASQHVLDLTRGHPYLVQLLCSEIVTRKNDQEANSRRCATLADVEAVVPETLVRGQNFFADIEFNQVDAHGLAILRLIASTREGIKHTAGTLHQAVAAPDQRENTLNVLRRRELIEEVNGAISFRLR